MKIKNKKDKAKALLREAYNAERKCISIYAIDRACALSGLHYIEAISIIENIEKEGSYGY